MFLSGAESRTTSRTSPNVPDQRDKSAKMENTGNEGGISKAEARYINQLAEAARSPEAQKIEELFIQGYRKVVTGKAEMPDIGGSHRSDVMKLESDYQTDQIYP